MTFYISKAILFHIKQFFLFSVCCDFLAASFETFVNIASIYPTDSRSIHSSRLLQPLSSYCLVKISRCILLVSLSSGCNSRTSTEYQCRHRHSLLPFLPFSILFVSGHKSLEESAFRLGRGIRGREIE